MGALHTIDAKQSAEHMSWKMMYNRFVHIVGITFG